MMEFYLKLDNNVIDTNLVYELVDNVYHINIESNGTYLFDYNLTNKTNLIFNIYKNLNLFINQEFNLIKDDLFITYNLDNNSTLTQFNTSNNDLSKINLHQIVNVFENSKYNLSQAYFNDDDLAIKLDVNLLKDNAYASTNLACISRLENNKIFDLNIVSKHANTYGEMNNFGVVKDKATLIFNGIGKIEKNASNSTAHQASKIITFSNGVNAQANPYLIIDESDVIASHAAAVGKMDEDQLYYLQSRGISFEVASQLITYGYLKPVLAKIKNEELKLKLEQLIEQKVGL